jgi:DNA-binding LacI/PurR family transcriptional regulator
MTKISLPQQLALEFKRRIATGEYTPNSFMPPERALATEFDTSRETISAALSILADEGLVERRRGRGTRVILWPEYHNSQPTIAIFVFDKMGSHEGMYIFHGIQKTLSQLGYRYELFSIRWSSASDYSSLLSTEEIMSRFKGAIYIESMICDSQILELQEKGFPVVVANLETDLNVSCSWCDHEQTTKEAVRMLSSLGHKRIAYLGRNPDHYFYGKSLAGYREGLKEAGIQPDEALEILVPVSTSIQAYIRTKELLKIKNPPTAIVTARDLYAEGIFQAAQGAGLCVGRDISVIGFDDISWQQEDPTLTTFHEPCFEMGKTAAEILLDHMLTGSREIVKRKIESPLVLRRSAGPLI